ncbi:putative Ig domain-containing protein [candidate division CSSED10-310 bacterium]|uniref:Pyrrolidone-carboxylate peptidase n=1 Tax=candidate division CSSED10-310 bacterium TaxID=2855610 RepID=A0ABV6Z090_UNCC1
MNGSKFKLCCMFLLCLLIFIAACEDSDDDTIWIFTTELPDGRVLFAYSVSLEARDSQGQVFWSLIFGELPPGLTLDSNGLIQGEPSTSGEYAFTVKVKDDHGESIADLTIDIPPVVLMSGFEPFGGYDTNPSYESLKPLDEQIYAGLDIRVVELPVVWDDSWDILQAAILLLKPTVIISTGQAGTDAIRFETTAKNAQMGTDNDGETRDGEEIIVGGPETLATGLPITEMSSAMESQGFTTKISNNAGKFLCNFIFYQLMYYVQFQATDSLVAGFIHVPPAPYAGTFTVEEITNAHKIGLQALSDWMQSGQTAQAVDIDLSTEPVYFQVFDKAQP